MAEKRIILSVALAVYNEAKNLKRCLESVKAIAHEIIVVDGGSKDKTVEIAKQCGAIIIQTDNPPIFHINKQKALDRCHGDWILQLDADEVIDDTLMREIKETIARSHAKDGYYIPRRNYFLGDWLRKGGQHPDYVIRLFRNGKGKFPSISVHEQITIDGSVGYVKHALDHYSYTSVKRYWEKSDSYVRLLSKEISGNNPVISFFAYVFIKPVYTFLLIFVRHKGFVDGWRGFLFALFSAMHFPAAYFIWRGKK